MNSKVVIAIGSVIGLIAIIFAAKNMKQDTPKQEVAKAKAPMTLEERLAMDKDSLNEFVSSGTGNKHELYGAMIRLTEQKDPLGEKVAIQLASSEERLHREGAAQSLGNFSSEAAMTKLVELTQDEEPTVRQFALKGFGKIQSPERAKIIKDLITTSKISPDEKVYLYTGYYLSSADNKDKDWAVGKLMTLSRSKDKKVSRNATLQVLQIAPRHEKTKSMIYRKIEGVADEKVIGIGIRILAQQRDPWLPPKLKNLAKHKSPMVRKAVIQSLHKHCPKNRWNLLNAIADKEENKSVIETMIREATLLSGTDAKGFLEKLTAKKLHKRAQDLITAGQQKIASAKGPCR